MNLSKVNLRKVGVVGLTAASTLVLAGCLVGPDYHKPEATARMPAAYTGAGEGWKVAQPGTNTIKVNWWEQYGDSELNELESKSTTANQQLKAAVARFTQAREVANVARSGLFPHVGAGAGITRQRNSEHNGNSSAGQTDTAFSIPFDLSYEIDLWGRVRRTIEAAKADTQANADDVAALRLSIQAEVAADYFTLRSLDSEYALLKTNINVFEKSLGLTKNRRAGGIATDLDVSQAETVLRNAEAELPRVQLQRLKLQHALAVLVGEPASTFSLREKPLNLQPLTVPTGLPSELLERRPDIAAAERRMASANAQIGVAKAAFFPTVKLNGLAGLQSIDAGTLFSWPSRIWAVGPSLTVPIFEGGRLRADLRRAKAGYEENIANYRQQVLISFAEVEDNLAGEQLLAKEYSAREQALSSTRRTLEIAMNRYRGGLVTFLEVASAQNEELARERELVRVHGEQLVTSVALVKALGGGWSEDQSHNVAAVQKPTAIARQ